MSVLFNDYTEKPFLVRTGRLFPRARADYDLKPEMSAYEVTDVVLERLDSKNTTLLLSTLLIPIWWAIPHSRRGDKAAETVDLCRQNPGQVKQLGGPR